MIDGCICAARVTAQNNLFTSTGCTTHSVQQYIWLPTSSRVQAVQQYSTYKVQQQYSTYELACTQCRVYSPNYEHCCIPEHVQTPKRDSSCPACNAAAAIASAFLCCCYYYCRPRRVSASLAAPKCRWCRSLHGGKKLSVPCPLSSQISRSSFVAMCAF